AMGLLRFLKEVRGWLLDAYEHEVFASGLLHEKLAIDRAPGLPPLMSVVFNLEPGNAAPATFAGLEVEAVEGATTPFAKRDLHVDAVETGDGIELICIFNRE